MPQKTVQIGEQELRLDWTRRYRSLSVYTNEQPLWTFQNRQDLQLGRKLRLSDGQIVTVILSDPHGLEVWHNGREMLSNTQTGYVRKASPAERALWLVFEVLGGMLEVSF
jgi:hypothetical protein